MTHKSGVRPRGTDDLANDNPPQEQWRLQCDDDSAARLALYSARAHLE